MKTKTSLLIPFAMLALSGGGLLTSCSEEKVNDALDNRPAEGVQDAVEDIADEVEDATN